MHICLSIEIHFQSKSNMRRKKYILFNKQEIQVATRCITQMVQLVNFKKEIQYLEAGKEPHASSNLICLCLILDDDKIFRVGGRLKNAQLSEN